MEWPLIEINMYRRDTYLHQLERVLDKETMEECKTFINRVVECRHNRVLDQQEAEFEVLVQWKTSGHSNQDVQRKRDAGKDKWVINLSSTPLTEDQEKLLAHGPKFVITPRQAPVNEYIAATDQACTKLEQGKQEEFRVEVKKTTAARSKQKKINQC